MDKMKWLISFLVAVLIFFGWNQYSQSSYYMKNDTIFEINKEDIFFISITQNKDSLSLSFDGEQWAIDDHDSLIIKQNTLDTFFEKIISLKKGSLVSKNEKNWDKYMVGDSTGTHLQFKDYNGNIIAEAIIGRSSSEWSSSNIRINNSVEVFQTNENISWQVNPSATYWGEVPAVEEDSLSTDLQ